MPRKKTECCGDRSAELNFVMITEGEMHDTQK